MFNQVYANVLGQPVLVPSKRVTSLGSAIFAFMAAGAFKTIEEAQDKICPGHTVFTPEPMAQKVYNSLYALYHRIYFGFGQPGTGKFGDVLPTLISVAEKANSQT